MNRLLSLTLLLGWTAAVSAQDIPSIELKDLADMTVDTRAFVEEAEGPVLFCFWATRNQILPLHLSDQTCEIGVHRLCSLDQCFRVPLCRK